MQETLEAEVMALAGTRYPRAGRQPGHVRWSQQQGSVYLGDQKLPVRFPRVRNRHTNAEVPLATYEKLQRPRDLDDGLLRCVLVGLSCGRYRECAQTVPEAFGVARAAVSRRFVRASARRLQTLLERALTGHDFVAVFLDGKSVAGDALVIAVGVTLQGEKVFLGWCRPPPRTPACSLSFCKGWWPVGCAPRGGPVVARRWRGKRLRAAIRTVADPDAVVQRCQWHKRENVVSYLPKSRQAAVRTQLQTAYRQPTYEAAKAQLDTLGQALAWENPSAAASLREGLDETLTLHRLGLTPVLSRSFATTNVLESINAKVERAIRRVTRWQSGEQKLRWVASTLLDLEPRRRRAKGYLALPQLRATLLRQAASATKATGQAA